MDSVLIILLADDPEALGSTAAVFLAVSRPDSANLRTKPHVIGRQRIACSWICSINLSATFRPCTHPEFVVMLLRALRRVRNSHMHQNIFSSDIYSSPFSMQ